MAAHKHYHCACSSVGWLNVGKARNHVRVMSARSDQLEISSSQGTATHRTGAKLLSRCVPRERPVREKHGSVSANADLPQMAMRFAHGRHADIDSRLNKLTYGCLLNRLKEYHHLANATGVSHAMHINSLLAPGWQVQYTRDGQRCFGIVTAVPEHEQVVVKEIGKGQENDMTSRKEVLPIIDIEAAGYFATFDFKRQAYVLLDESQQHVAHVACETFVVNAIRRKLRDLPSLPEAPQTQVNLDCPWPILRVSPLQSMAEHAGHAIRNKVIPSKKVVTRCILEDPPRFWTPMPIICKTCGNKEFHPKLADIRAYFPSLTILRTGNTYYTLQFLLSLVTHFTIHPVESDLRVWLAERWCNYDVKLQWHRMSIFPDMAEETAVTHVPWLLLALRSCKVLTNLVQEFILHFCSIWELLTSYLFFPCVLGDQKDENVVPSEPAIFQTCSDSNKYSISSR